MKEKVLGYPQSAALKMGLDVIDLMLVALVKDKLSSAKTKKYESGGKLYVWVSYQSVIDWLPILKMQKRSLARRMGRLCRMGILDTYCDRHDGSYTYYRFVGVTESPAGCDEKSRGAGMKSPDKESTVIIDTVSSKEKDDKKKDAVEEFERVFLETTEKMKTDELVAMMLSGYHISDLDALFTEWRRHIIKNLKQKSFINDGYERNKRYLSYCMGYLDLSKATHVKLGKGEYLKDGRRYYVNPRGEEKEVPTDAPPRQLTSQVWYADEKKWGPML